MYQISVFVHVISAMLWVGGMLFLGLVVVPITRDMPAEQRSALFGAAGRRFRSVGWVCIGLLLVTGWINLTYRGVTVQSLFSGQAFVGELGGVLAIKLALVAVMLVISVVHDFFLGPRSVQAIERGTATPEQIAAFRRRASLVGRLNTLLGLMAVLLGVMLVRGVPGLI
ncbi:MAG: DUF4149 domain-containing protein [Chloroflexota bacterium]